MSRLGFLAALVFLFGVTALPAGSSLSPRMAASYQAARAAVASGDMARAAAAFVALSEESGGRIGESLEDASGWVPAEHKHALIEHLTSALGDRTDLPFCRLLVAQLHFECGDPSSAYAVTKKTLYSASSKDAQEECLILIGRLYAHARDVGKLVNLLVYAEKAYPGRVAANAMYHLQLSIPNEIRKDLADVLASAILGKPDLMLCQRLLMRQYLALEEIDQARAVAEDLLRKAGDDASLLLSLGLLGKHYPGLQQFSIKALKRLVEVEPNNYQRLRTLGQAYARAGDEAGAAGQAEALMSKWPNDGRAICAAGDLFRRLKRWDDAVDAYDRAAKANPAEADSYAHRKAQTYIDAGATDKAMALLESLRQTATADWIQWECCRQLVEMYTARHEIEELAAMLLETERTRPAVESSGFVSRVGVGLPNEEKRSLVELLAKATRQEPDLFYCRLYQVKLWADLENRGAALAIIRELRPKIEVDRTLVRQISRLFHHKRGPVELYELLAELDPKDPGIATALAWTYVEAERKAEASTLARRILEQWPRYAPAMADVFKRTEEWDEAIRALGIAAETYPDKWDRYKSQIEQIQLWRSRPRSPEPALPPWR